jgi:phosphate transport system substrate-binding protein
MHAGAPGRPPAQLDPREGPHVTRTHLRHAAKPAIAASILILSLTACGGQQEPTDTSGSGGDSSSGNQTLSGSVAIDGSSTVQPLSSAAAELFQEEQPDVQVSVGTAGTGGGFEAFCAGKTDISDASRPIEAEETKICKEAGIDYTELHVATDALTVVTNPDVGVDCITTEQLKKIWEPSAEQKITNWKQVDSSFPDLPLNLFGPGTDSGTFDYFTDEINGEEGASRSDYEASEDDNVVVDGVANTEGGMGYFGYTYYEQNADKLTAMQVDSGDGCVEPSAETAQSGEYTPLSRPLFIYVADKAYADSPQVAAYVDYYIDNLPTITEAAQYIPLNEQQAKKTQGALNAMK